MTPLGSDFSIDSAATDYVGLPPTPGVKRHDRCAHVGSKRFLEAVVPTRERSRWPCPQQYARERPQLPFLYLDLPHFGGFKMPGTTIRAPDREIAVIELYFQRRVELMFVPVARRHVDDDIGVDLNDPAVDELQFHEPPGMRSGRGIVKNFELRGADWIALDAPRKHRHQTTYRE
jgi:hypothetical protein